MIWSQIFWTTRRETRRLNEATLAAFENQAQDSRIAPKARPQNLITFDQFWGSNATYYVCQPAAANRKRVRGCAHLFSPAFSRTLPGFQTQGRLGRESPAIAGCLGLTGMANKLHFGDSMRPYLVQCAPVLISPAPSGQSPAPPSAVFFNYGCEPYIPCYWRK
jgi:hypothetical protein